MAGPDCAHGGNHRWQARALEASTANAVLVAPRMRSQPTKAAILKHGMAAPTAPGLGSKRSRGLEAERLGGVSVSNDQHSRETNEAHHRASPCSIHQQRRHLEAI
jgi:hypothetical protein